MTPSIVIPPDMDIPSLGNLVDDLLAAMSTTKAVRLDVSAVPVCAPSAAPLLLQVIAAARRHAAETGIDFTLAGHASSAFAALLERGGFAPTTPDDISFWHGDISR